MAVSAAATPAPPATRTERLKAVRAWRQATVPGPTLAQRAGTVYTFVLVTAIFGVGIFDAVDQALAQVLTYDGAATWGPSVALVAFVVVARWGAYQGPVVYAVADVAHLLGAPLDRRALAARRLLTSMAVGGVVGAVLGGVVALGLAGDGRSIAAGRAIGLIVSLATAGVLGVAAAWGVQASARAERALGPSTWLALAAGTAAGVLGERHPDLVRFVSWSGPWGWATTPVQTDAWPLALGLLVVTTVVAATLAVRRCGRCPAERHLRRAEARAGAVASLAAFDARSMRQALSTAAIGRAPRATGARASGWPARSGLTSLSMWRGTAALRRTPARGAEALVLGGGGAALLLVAADRVTAALVGGLLLFVAGTRLMEPLREEVDKPGRTRILLRAPWGRILFAHAALPALVLLSAVLVGTAACEVGGATLAPAGALMVTAVLAVPVTVLAAALSARRGGRLPPSVLAMATNTDTGGTGGFVVVGWLLLWPSVGAIGAGVPAALVPTSGTAGLTPAVLLSLIVSAILTTILRASKAP